MATSRGQLHERPESKQREMVIYNELAIRSNISILDYSRTSMSALAGSTAGILGLTGLYGFIFYFVASLALSFLLFIETGRNWQKYFRVRRPLVTHGLVGGLFALVIVAGMVLDSLHTFYFGPFYTVWFMYTNRSLRRRTFISTVPDRTAMIHRHSLSP